MVFSNDSMHLNYDHISLIQGIQNYCGISTAQQHIMIERLYQIYTVAHKIGKRRVLAFQ